MDQGTALSALKVLYDTILLESGVFSFSWTVWGEGLRSDGKECE